MLPRSGKLTVRQVDEVLAKGRVAHSGSFLMRYTTGNADTRISAIIPKKVGKTAVSRSVSRSVIYNSVKMLFPKLVHGSHVALFAKTVFKNSDIDKLVGEIKELFVKTGLLR